MDNITFKQFKEWCNDRTCDGCWGMLEALACIDLIDRVSLISFWKREKLWRKEYEEKILKEIVNPINNKILKLK